MIVADALPPGCDWAGVRRRQEQAQEQAAGRSGLRRALRLLGMTRSSSDPALASHVEEQPSVKLIAGGYITVINGSAGVACLPGPLPGQAGLHTRRLPVAPLYKR